MNQPQKLLSIIIPVYNEQSTIADIIERTKAASQQTGLKTEIIVIDDHSYDKSLQIAKNHRTRLFTLKEHSGKGSALQVGFLKAKGDVIVTIDSDGSHWPEELSEILAPVLQNKADLVIGSRYLNRKHVAARKLNAFGVRIFNRLIELLTGVAITDSQSGYRAMTRQVLKSQKLKSIGYEIESEMLVKTAKGGFRVTEVPITFQQRTYGRSGVDPLKDGFRISLSIFLAYVRG